MEKEKRERDGQGGKGLEWALQIKIHTEMTFNEMKVDVDSFLWVFSK